ASHGVPRSKFWGDPGLGFAKTAEQSLTLLAGLESLRTLDARVLVGASRKSFLAAVTRRSGMEPASADARLGASVAAAILAMNHGAHAVRVHDVAETRQALDFAVAFSGARGAAS
ncbi:MAG: dihydropteroate synthase, partial [Myxococcales bacterium]|nr:dihydropteroate synthase [Myxococcales bacterium]